MTVKKLLSGDYVSAPRNKQIASVFKEAGIIEKYGSGIRRIRLAMVNAGNPEPIFEEIGEGFRVTLLKTPLQITPPIKSKRVSLEDKILSVIRENPEVMKSDIATALGIAGSTVKEYLTKLKKQGRIINNRFFGSFVFVRREVTRNYAFNSRFKRSLLCRWLWHIPRA